MFCRISINLFILYKVKICQFNQLNRKYLLLYKLFPVYSYLTTVKRNVYQQYFNVNNYTLFLLILNAMFC